MADIRQSLFQQPSDRIKSITQLNKMIADSKEVKDWDLQINLEPDQIEAKVLQRPGILMFNGPQPLGNVALQAPPTTTAATGAPLMQSASGHSTTSTNKTLDDTNILR